MSHRLKALWWVAFSLISTCLTFHFFILFITAMPLNPIQYTFAGILDTYNDTFFTQNWRFFAPTPASTNFVVLARASSDHSIVLQSTPWLDLTDPLIDAVQQNRFTELQIPELMLSNATISLANAGILDSRSASYKAIAHGEYSPDFLLVARYACHVLNQAYPHSHFESLQLAFTETQPPDFLHYMEDGNQVVASVVLPPMKYESVA